MVLKGSTDEFTVSKNPPKKYVMKDWNPLLLAIAYKRVEIVRYLIQDLKVSFKLATRDPTIEPIPANATISYQHISFERSNKIFGLHLAIINRDLPMLEELWNKSSLCPYWEKDHLNSLIHELSFASDKGWPQGL